MIFLAITIIITALTGVSSFVLTCNEIKTMSETYVDGINATRACVYIASTVKPFEQLPYSAYVNSTFVIDNGSNEMYSVSSFIDGEPSCVTGIGPWTISFNEEELLCSSPTMKYAEILFLFSSDDSQIIQADPLIPSTMSYGRGSYTFVAVEGSLQLLKKNISDGDEATLRFYTGIGLNEREERYAISPETFEAGTATIVIGPVTTLEIDDDVQIELAVSSFGDQNANAVEAGYQFSIMSSGKASSLQSSRAILLSTSFEKDGDEILYDAVAVTGTVKLDDASPTTLSIKCIVSSSGTNTEKTFSDTGDVVYNEDCSTLDITYIGGLSADEIGRSSEVVYLRVASSANPVYESSTTPQSSATTSEVQSTTTNGGRTLESTVRSTTIRSTTPSTTTLALTSTTVERTTTAGANARNTLACIIVLLMLLA